MTESIAKVLLEDNYIKIQSNVSYLSLYVKYEGDFAKAVQLIDCENYYGMTKEQFDIFCKKAASFMQMKGYEQKDLLTIIVTRSSNNAKIFATGNEKCWIVDALNPRLLVFEEQPNDFYGIRDGIEEAIEKEQDKHLSSAHDVEYSEEGRMRRYEASGKQTLFKFITPVNTIMIAVNILAFIVLSIIGASKGLDGITATENVFFMLKYGAMYEPLIVDSGQYYRLVTCMFMHFGMMHLMSNMLALFFLGELVEKKVGSVRYALIYILGGLVGSVGSLLHCIITGKNVVSAGASGSVFAVMGAIVWLTFISNGRFEQFTLEKLIFIIFVELMQGLSSSNIDMSAHVCGLIGGFVVAMIVYSKKRDNIAKGH